MPYLIDGHNLIPNIPGLSLDTIDDEIRLIERLQVFQQQSRKKIEVFFDNAPPSKNRTQKYAGVVAHFIRRGITADEAIHRRIQALGRGVSTWTVVSSDRAVQAAARAAHARVISSEEFAKELGQISKGSPDETIETDVQLSNKEVNEWLEVFSNRKDSKQ